MWRGFTKFYNSKNKCIFNIPRIKRYRARKSSLRCWRHWTYSQLFKRRFSFHIPFTWEFVIFRKLRLRNLLKWQPPNTIPYRLIFVYSGIYYYVCPLPAIWRTRVQNYLNSSVEIISRQLTHHTLSYFARFSLFFASAHRPFFHKLKFKGKGYYMYRNVRNTITPQLGHAHRIFTYTFFLVVRFFKRGAFRRSILLTGWLKDHLHKGAWDIREMRRQNIFTGRGVRFARDRIYRKPGKISTYR